MNDNRNKRSICYVATTGKCLALFIWPQAKFLAEHGWQVTLVASEDKRLRKLADSQPNVRFIPFAMRRRASLIDAVKFPFKLFMLFRREKFNFVQYFMPNAAFYSAIAARAAGIKFRYYQLGGLRYSAAGGIKRFLLKVPDIIACKCSTQVVCVSRGNLEMAVRDRLFPACKGVIIGHGGSKGVDMTVFDLFSGTGTISQVLAPVAKQVVGVEIVEEAVEAAKENAARNGISNCKFIAGDVFQVLDELEEKPDVIVLDPPRDGIHPKALPKILSYGVGRIVYISCKMTSLARDLEMMQMAGYRVERMTAVDQFCETVHCEVVALLENWRKQ